ncbi:hypothetical protein GCM10010220_23310 [Streptomyces parvulus]|nr:hypothetical protein GCM10010220_23310 [Streptomyces parvulus]
MGASAYDRERLEEAARGARTLSEALRRLGVDPKSWKRRYIFDRMRKLGVDVSHFEREGAKWTREILEAVVAESASVYDVLRRLGLPPVGGHHANISRRIKAYGIDTSHFAPVVRTERQRLNQRRRTPAEILVEDTSGSVQADPGQPSEEGDASLARRSAARSATLSPCGWGSLCPWRSITSMATGGTTVWRIFASCVPTAIRRRTVTAAGERGSPHDRSEAPPHGGGAANGSRRLELPGRGPTQSGPTGQRLTTWAATQMDCRASDLDITFPRAGSSKGETRHERQASE